MTNSQPQPPADEQPAPRLARTTSPQLLDRILPEGEEKRLDVAAFTSSI